MPATIDFEPEAATPAPKTGGPAQIDFEPEQIDFDAGVPPIEPSSNLSTNAVATPALSRLISQTKFPTGGKFTKQQLVGTKRQLEENRSTEQIEGVIDELASGEWQNKSDIPGLSPENVPSGEAISDKTGLPIWASVPMSALAKGGAGLGEFFTSPSGIAQSILAASPVGIVQRAKWLYDLAQSSGTSAGNLTSMLQKYYADPKSLTTDDFQAMADEAVNTAGGLYMAGKMGEGEFTHVTGLPAPVVGGRQARMSQYLAKTLDRQPLKPYFQPAAQAPNQYFQPAGVEQTPPAAGPAPVDFQPESPASGAMPGTPATPGQAGKPSPIDEIIDQIKQNVVPPRPPVVAGEEKPSGPTPQPPPVEAPKPSQPEPEPRVRPGPVETADEQARIRDQIDLLESADSVGGLTKSGQKRLQDLRAQLQTPSTETAKAASAAPEATNTSVGETGASMTPAMTPEQSQAYRSRFLDNVLSNSRTAAGTIDTSVSAEKPGAAVAGDQLVQQSKANAQKLFEHAAGADFSTPESTSRFIQQANAIANEGISQPALRTWPGKPDFKYIPPAEIPSALKSFSQELSQRIKSGEDPVKTAAWAEQTFDMRIHPYADGVGRTTKALGAAILMRGKADLPAYPLEKYPDPRSYYGHAKDTPAQFEEFYRSRINVAKADAKDKTPTLKRTTMPDGEARPAWRSRQTDRIAAGAARSKSPSIIFMGGGPGSGKNTLLNELREAGLLSKEFKLSIDSDDIKVGSKEYANLGSYPIPEFEAAARARDPDSSVVVHKESSLMAKETLSKVLRKGRSAVFNATMRDSHEDMALIDEVRKAEHNVSMIGVWVRPDIALARGKERAKITNREAPEELYAKGALGFAASFPDYIKALDNMVLYDRNQDGKSIPIFRKDEKGIEIIDEKRYSEFERAGQDERERQGKQRGEYGSKGASAEPAGKPAGTGGHQRGAEAAGGGGAKEPAAGADQVAGELKEPEHVEQSGQTEHGGGGAPGEKPAAALPSGEVETSGALPSGEASGLQSSGGAAESWPAEAKPVERAGEPATAADGRVGEQEQGPAERGSGKGNSGGGKPNRREGIAIEQLPGETLRPNLRLTESPEPGTPTQRIKANVAAIRILKQLQEEKRKPTDAERAELAKWSGWGSFKNIFNTGKAERREWDPNWVKAYGKYYDQLRELLNDEEFNAAAESSVNAHYTSKPIIDFMWKLARRLGFKGGRVLEPGAGSGLFLGFEPADLAERTKWTSVEMDPVTGRILGHLYPESDTRIQPFEETKLPNGYFDMAISNVPFHEVGPGKEYPDLNLHNYFLARMIDKVKPGGLVIAISSKGTMDANIKQRMMLTGKAQFIGAVRFPSNAFKENAGTEVVTDMLVFRRPTGRSFESEPWKNLTNVAPEGETPIMVNEYYAKHPENALGRHALTGTMYRGGSYNLESTGPLEPKLEAALQRFPENITQIEPSAGEEAAATEREDFQLYVNDSGHVVESRGYKESLPSWDSGSPALVKRAKLYIGTRDALRQQYALERDPNATDAQIEANRKSLNAAYQNLTKELGGPINGIGSGRKLNYLQTDPDFYTLKGLENVHEIVDPEDPTKTITEFTPADVLSKRVGEVDKAPVKAGSATEALAVSVAYKGNLDLPYIQELTGMEPEAVERELAGSGLAFIDPDSGQLQTRSEYLGGDIRTKYAQAVFAAKEDPRFEANAKALKDVIPPTVPFEKIKFGPEARWIPVEVHNAFAQEVIGLAPDQVVYTPAVDSFSVKTGRYGGYASEKARVDWSTPDRSAAEILDAALNMKRIHVTFTDEDGKSHEDVPASAAANELADKMRAEFKNWTSGTESRVPYRYFDSDKGAFVNENLPVWDVMERAFNVKKNSFVDPDFDGAKLALPGVNNDWFWRKKHIMDGIQRGIQQGSCVFAYGVGSGKTSLMTILDRELKRIGLARKTLIAVKKSTVDQFRTTVEALYPGSRVLIPTKDDFKKANRRKLFARIAAGRFDHIILTHEQFKSIPSSEQGIRDFFNDQIEGLRQSLIDLDHADAENAKSTRGMDRQVAQIVRQLKTLKKQLDKQITAIKSHQDAGLTWDDLGIDAIHMDESHNFKNIPVTTSLEDIKGIPSSFSQRAVDLIVKARSVQKKTNGRNVFFYTGTPVSNTLAELWGQIHVINPNLLEGMGLKTFDSFASAFAEVTSNFEFGWDQKFREVTRMSKFKNGAALTTLTRMGLAVKMGNKELGLDVPEMEGGGPQVRLVPRHPAFKRWTDMVEDIAEEWNGLDNKGRFENSWVPIATMRAGSAAAIDPRLVFPEAPDHPDSKVNAAVNDIVKEWEAGKERRTTMMVFGDLYRTINTDKLRDFLGGKHDTAIDEANKVTVVDLDKPPEVPEEKEAQEDSGIDMAANAEEDAANANAVGQFNLYNDVRQKLIQRGIPENEIAIITEHETDEKRKTLFNKVRAGAVRVLIGSTEKIGEGVDVPQRMSAEFHLDPPMQMTAAKMEQRIGRLVRQGNLHSPKNWNLPVRALLYAQEGSMDAPIYSSMERKGKMMIQALKGQFLGDEFEDPASEITAAMGQLVAEATGDKRALELAKLTEDVRRLNIAEAAYLRNKSDTRRNIDSYQRQAEWKQRRAEQFADIAGAGREASGTKETVEMSVGKQKFTGDDDVKDALDEIQDRLDRETEKPKTEAISLVRFGKNLWAFIKATADMEHDEKGNPVLGRHYSAELTKSDSKPNYSERGFDSDRFTIYSQPADLKRILSSVRNLEGRATDEAAKLKSGAEKDLAESKSYETKLAGIKFDKADELKAKRAELDSLQADLMGSPTRSAAAAMRAARRHGLLFEQPETPLSLEAERQQLRRRIGEIETSSGAEHDAEIAEEVNKNKALHSQLMTAENWEKRVLEQRIESRENRIKELQAEQPGADQVKPLREKLQEIERKMLDWLDKAVKATDYTGADVMEGVTGAPIWITKGLANGALRVVRSAVRNGMALAEAIDKGVSWLKNRAGDAFVDADARSWLKGATMRGEGTGTLSYEQALDAVNSAGQDLKAAIAQHQRPPAGMTKRAALNEKHAATRRFREAQQALYRHPEHADKLLRERKRLQDAEQTAARSGNNLERERARSEMEEVQKEIDRVPKSVYQAAMKRLGRTNQQTREFEPDETMLRNMNPEPVPRMNESRRVELAHAIGDLPYQAREVYRNAMTARQKLGAMIAKRDNSDAISYTKDAADNKAQLFAKQVATLMQHELDRSFGWEPGRKRETADKWRDDALTFVIESGMSRLYLDEFKDMIAGSEFSRTPAARDALNAIEYAQKHWNRFIGPAETYAKLTDAQVGSENASGIATLHRSGGYVFHLQDVTAGWQHMQSGQGGGGTAAPFRHIRDIPTYAEAIARGVKPETLNAVDLLQRRVSLGQKLINYRAWIDAMRDMVDPATDLPVVTDTIVRVKADGTTDETAPYGYHIEHFGGQSIAVHSGYDGLFNDLTGESWMRRGQVRPLLLKAATTAKHGVLVFDSYHLGRLMFWNAFTRGGLPSFKKGVTLLDTSAADIRRMIEEKQLPESWGNTLLDDKRKLSLLVNNGLNVGHVADNIYSDWIQSIPGIGHFNRWLFDQYQRGAMSEVGMIEFARQQKAHPEWSEDKVARQVAHDVNIRFGNLGNQGWIKSKTGQDLARMMFLAPQWNESLIRAELNAYRQLGYELPKALLTGRGFQVGTLAKAFVTAAIGQFVANQIINYATRGQPTWDNKEEGFGSKLSAYIPDVLGAGNGFFLNPLHLPAEITNLLLEHTERTGDFTKAVKMYLSGRLNVFSRPVWTLVTREDPFGAKLRDAKEVTEQMVKGALPIPISAGSVAAAGKQLVTGRNEEQFPGQFEKQLLQTFGQKTKMVPTDEQRIRNLAGKFNDEKGIKPSGEFYHGDYMDFDTALRLNNPVKVQDALNDLLTKHTAQQIIKHYQQHATAPFTGSRGREMEFYDSLTPEQRQAYERAKDQRHQVALQVRDLLDNLR